MVAFERKRGNEADVRRIPVSARSAATRQSVLFRPFLA